MRMSIRMGFVFTIMANTALGPCTRIYNLCQKIKITAQNRKPKIRRWPMASR